MMPEHDVDGRNAATFDVARVRQIRPAILPNETRHEGRASHRSRLHVEATQPELRGEIQVEATTLALEDVLESKTTIERKSGQELRLRQQPRLRLRGVVRRGA